MFSQEVLLRKRNTYGGPVFINTPGSYVLFSVSLSVIVLLFITWTFVGEYTEKKSVKGYIDTLDGIVSIYPSRLGILIKSPLVGSSVKKGELLFIIDTSMNEYSIPQKTLLKELKKRQNRLSKAIDISEKQLAKFNSLLKKKFMAEQDYQDFEQHLDELKQKKSDLHLALIKAEKHRYEIRSPINGFVSANYVKTGQMIRMDKPLAKIMPDSGLIAELMIPADKCDLFIKNKVISLQYDAYPANEYGTYSAKIVSVSQSLTMAHEEDLPIPTRYAYYKAQARLMTPFIQYEGKQRRLHQGMTFSAVGLGSKHKLWQWLIKPFYPFHGA